MVGSWESHDAITRLLYGYHEHFNAGRFDLVAQLFAHATYRTEYPWSTAGHGEQLGAAAVQQAFDTMVVLHDGKPRVQYSLSNVIVDIDDDEGAARSRSQFVGIIGDRSSWDPTPSTDGQLRAGGTISIFTAGRYVDRFARTDGTWHFTERVVHADLTGDRRLHLQIEPTTYGHP
jgi:hypothetical protein